MNPRHIKLKNLNNIHRKARLILEEHVDIEQTRVLPNFDLGVCHIGAHSYVRGGEIHLVSSIGRYCSIGNDVMLGMDKQKHPLAYASTSHEVCENHKTQSLSSTIGHDVWIGQGAVVMSGVKVANGAVIGINSVVTKDVLPYEIVAGNPARHIRFRFEPDEIESLLQSEWWKIPIKTLRSFDYDNVPKFIDQVRNYNGSKACYRRFEISNRKFLIKS
ncbi:CatB-related O-acetyltransferase [Thiomicrorhabdus sp. Milos-T2]|uniref:CatB-related O-acetyltransferase n=1 Tax=Thiomicrorhabdus sp. Milos-T2 TaxID=90814 RepID=UPI0004946054|nr:CatB-related O-acetyltransferase [Thiomicrorhabdus sp. Milos-T2]